MKKNIQIISAPSNLGLQSNGVELLAQTLLQNGLAEKIGAISPIQHIPTLNDQRSNHRDPITQCLNPVVAHEFSLALGNAVAQTVHANYFALVLGGDCSILIGIMQGLKGIGNYGLIFIDAHADFYDPSTSTTGELADMDLAIVTGRGPGILTNINQRKPYVKDEHVVHIGQRDWEETKKYGSQDIRATDITCIPISEIGKTQIDIDQIAVEKFWIHFDTDVLNDDINPAVDYRLPGGLTFEQAEKIIQPLLQTGKIAGMSVTIYNPALDRNGSIGINITDSLERMFSCNTI